MSDRDVLREATEALREVTNEPGTGSEFTRARIMATLHRERRRRVAKIAVLVPLAAVLTGATAWAESTGKLPEVWEVMVGMMREPAATEATVVENGKGDRAPVAAAPSKVEAPVVPEEPVEVASPVEPEVDDIPAPALPAGVATIRPSSAPALPVAKTPKAQPKKQRRPAAPPVSASFELYKRAHRVHFAERNWGAALVAWDTYLREAPSGRFAVEARYNRAICFIRLGRRGEARTALAPFASGAYGAYRQEEAKKLTSALDD